MKVVFWGTYDTGKPRTRILIRGLRENGVDVLECHADVWSGVEDKSQISCWSQRLRLMLKWLSSYPRLILRYLRMPRHDVVIISYMGHLDVLVLWLFSKVRGVRIVWDAFISLYNTVVEDRELISPIHPLASLLFAWEYVACRAADLIILDTRAHADYFKQKFKVQSKRVNHVFVGVEPEAFPLRPQHNGLNGPNDVLTVLFYGQFIPLHGIETIVRAAKRTENEPIRWIIIGRGQEQSKIRDMLKKRPQLCVKWIPWVSYGELAKWIHLADICLGIFGNTEKAGRVIPNKVFQILATGTPLITRESPAIRELLSPDMPGVFLVPPNNPNSIIEALHMFMNQRNQFVDMALHRDLATCIKPSAIGRHLSRSIACLSST